MIQVVSHDPDWTLRFGIEAGRITRATGGAVVRVHHIGSTAIPRTKAKPIIDLLLEVVSLDAMDGKTPAMEALGYEAMGEFGIPGRRYFRLDDADGVRRYHVHAFESGVPAAVRHIAFRDYLRAHPLVAEAYGALKERLVQAYPNDMAAYIDGKDAFVKEQQRRALLWAGHAGAGPVV